jgi:UDP-2,3-diacylglucosamine pyrophosphatase LpxH
MNTADLSKYLDINPEESIIVVSDLHLGAFEGETTSRDFLSFLEWLENLCDKNKIVEVEIKHNSRKKLRPPQMLILLGDIMDLWVQRKSLREALFWDSFPVFSRLRDLPIPIVYVIGNHDREMYEIKGSFPIGEGGNRKIIIEPDQFSNSENTGQLINPKGLRLGKYEYTFLHGHQFDDKFHYIGPFAEFPSWVSNNSSVFEYYPWIRLISWCVSLVGIADIVLSWARLVSFIPSFINSIIFVAFGISIPISLISLRSEWLNSFYNAISRNPLGKKLQEFIRKNTHAHRGKQVDYFMAVRKFMGEMDKGGTNAVVFGHTHMPDDFNNEKFNKRFINSGSWDSEIPSDVNLAKGMRYHLVGKDKESAKLDEYFSRKFVYNSFIYVDKEGPLTLVWDVEKDYPKVRRLEIHRPILGT